MIGSQPGEFPLTDDYRDRLNAVGRMARPSGVLALISIGYGMLAGIAAATIMFASWRHPEEGLGAWIMLGIAVSLPAGITAGVLVARVERAATGLRHPQRFLWVLASVAAMVLAHWTVFALWLPLLVLDGEIDDAIYIVPAWIFAALAGAGLFGAMHLLRGRTWNGVTGDRRTTLPRVSTTVVAAFLYTVVALLPGLFVAMLAMEERDLAVAIGGWLAAGALVPSAAAMIAVWLYRQLPYGQGRNIGSLRFAELVGALWTTHWAVPFALAMIPLWDKGTGDRFIFASTAGLALVIGVGCWSFGRAWRSVPHVAAR